MVFVMFAQIVQAEAELAKLSEDVRISLNGLPCVLPWHHANWLAVNSVPAASPSATTVHFIIILLPAVLSAALALAGPSWRCAGPGGV